MNFSVGDEFHAALLSGWIEILGESWRPEGLGLLGCLDAMDRRLRVQFGQVSAQGIALRVGRCTFNGFIQTCGTELGITSLTFRLQPVLKRIQAGLVIVCNAMKEGASVPFWVQETEEANTIQCSVLPEMAQFIFWGFFQEYFEWSSNGKVFLSTRESTIENTWQLCFAKAPFDH